MDAFFALIGILVICVSASATICFAVWTDHMRKMKDRRLEQEKQDREFLLREVEVKQMAALSEKMIEKGMLPPMAKTYERSLR